MIALSFRVLEKAGSLSRFKTENSEELRTPVKDEAESLSESDEPANEIDKDEQSVSRLHIHSYPASGHCVEFAGTSHEIRRTRTRNIS